MQRVATPEFVTKFTIQPHVSDISLSNTVRVCGLFGVKRA